MFLVLFWLCAVAGLPTPNKYVAAPVDIVGGESLQLDLMRAAVSDVVKLERVVACASVDAPFMPYDESSPQNTGCNSPGYQSMEIYSKDAALVHGSLASKFGVRLASNGRTVYLQKRLVNVHTPVVHLDVQLLVTEKGFSDTGKTLKTARMCHEHVSYMMEKRYIPIGKGGGKTSPTKEDVQSDLDNNNNKEPKSLWQIVKNTLYNLFIGDAHKQREDDDYKSDHYETYVMGRPWFVYTMLGMSLALGIVVAILGAGYLTCLMIKHVRKCTRNRGMSYEDQQKREDQERTKKAFEAAQSLGVFTSGSGRAGGGGGVGRGNKARPASVSERKHKSNDPFGDHDDDEDTNLIEAMFQEL